MSILHPCKYGVRAVSEVRARYHAPHVFVKFFRGQVCVRRSWESRDATILASASAAAILPLCVCAFSTPSVGRHGRVRTTPVAMKAGSNHLTSSGRLLRAQAYRSCFSFPELMARVVQARRSGHDLLLFSRCMR